METSWYTQFDTNKLLETSWYRQETSGRREADGGRRRADVQQKVRTPHGDVGKTQLQPPFGSSVDSLCHPCITATHLSYSVLSLKLSPPPCAVLLVTVKNGEWWGFWSDGLSPDTMVVSLLSHGRMMSNDWMIWGYHHSRQHPCYRGLCFLLVFFVQRWWEKFNLSYICVVNLMSHADW